MAREHADYLPKCNKGTVLATTFLHGMGGWSRSFRGQQKMLCRLKGREPSKAMRQSSLNYKSVEKAKVLHKGMKRLAIRKKGNFLVI